MKVVRIILNVDIDFFLFLFHSFVSYQKWISRSTTLPHQEKKLTIEKQRQKKYQCIFVV